MPRTTEQTWTNVPANLQDKMTRCVHDVQAKGHSKDSAIGICYAQLVEGKELPVRHFVEAAIRPPEAEGELTGREWDVTIIGPESEADLIEHDGHEYIKSKNGRWYDTAALRKSVPSWEGIKVYDNHLTDQQFKERGGMRSVATEWIGSIVRPRWDAAARAIKGTLRIVEEGLARKLKGAWEAQVLETIGLSIDTFPTGREILYQGQKIPIVDGFREILSVDLVTEPAAGGKFNRILAAKEVNRMPPFDEEQRAELRQMIGTVVAEALKDHAPEQEEMEPEEAAEEVAQAAAEVADAAPPDADPAAVAQAAADAAQAKADEIVEEAPESEAAKAALAKAKEWKDNLAEHTQRIAEAIKAKRNPQQPATTGDADKDLPQKVRVMECRLLLRDKLDAAKLPAELRGIVSAAYEGKVFKEQELDGMIKRVKEAHVALDPTGRVTGAGSGRRAQVGMDGRDKAEVEFLRLLMGNMAFRALEHNEKPYVQERISEAYKAHVKAGRQPIGYRRISELIYDLLGGDPFSDQRAYESLTTSNMSSIVKNALNVMLANAYSMRSEWWTPIVTEEEVDTIDQATLVRVYGMNTLSVVDEGTAYTELQWRDDEETPTFVKKGNYVGVTIETLLRDKINVVRRIPDLLANSWYNTLSALVSAVFTTNTAAGPVLGDTGALFNATAVTTAGGHANLLTTALGFTGYEAARVAMMKQTDQYSGGGTEVGIRLLIKPRYLLVPADLEGMGLRIRNAENLPGSADNDPNPFRDESDVVVVPEWTDTNNWALVGDPKLYPAIWLIFLRGRRVPELFTADSETQGAMFTNDTLRFKVRLLTWRFSSTYDCAPVSDWRPLHKSNVS